MASLVLTGDTSGQVTIAAPAVAGTNTVTLAAQTGTLNVAGPAFSAYASSATNTATATFTKLVFATEEFDTNNNFANSTFTPTVAGYYQINGATSGGFSTMIVSVFKNGTEYKRGTQALGATLSLANVSTIVYLNGSTDYVELYWYQASGSTQNSAVGSSVSYFNGCLVRGA